MVLNLNSKIVIGFISDLRRIAGQTGTSTKLGDRRTEIVRAVRVLPSGTKLKIYLDPKRIFEIFNRLRQNTVSQLVCYRS